MYEYLYARSNHKQSLHVHILFLQETKKTSFSIEHLALKRADNIIEDIQVLADNFNPDTPLKTSETLKLILNNEQFDTGNFAMIINLSSDQVNNIFTKALEHDNPSREQPYTNTS